MNQNPPKRTADDAGLPLGSGRRRSHRRRPDLTRQERAMIRILDHHGLSKEVIGKRLECAPSTVYNILKKALPPASHDFGNEYDYVGDEFKAEFPPKRQDVDEKKIKFEDDEVMEEKHLPAIVVRKDSFKMPEPKKSSNTSPRKTTSTPVGGTIVRRRSKRHSVAIPVTPVHQSHPTAGPSRQRPILIDLEKEASDEDDVQEDFESPVVRFLSGLDHDLSSVHGALKKQDLGTTTKLFAIAGWPEEELHKMFKEALPEITIAQRFILVKGLKKHAAT
ncbi:hypothetical protein Hypma_013121 [Hypsizygus marmoreus]|uniref:Uncharacterized protein n=1 Tax=Hypsizygus marmoreus TaxID=39966 RepID=A0A369JJK7_HYPMA|nr:hypothetical protein Hypma_013121 [Hypsizygus marmoreus]